MGMFDDANEQAASFGAVSIGESFMAIVLEITHPPKYLERINKTNAELKEQQKANPMAVAGQKPKQPTFKEGGIACKFLYLKSGSDLSNLEVDHLTPAGDKLVYDAKSVGYISVHPPTFHAQYSIEPDYVIGGKAYEGAFDNYEPRIIRPYKPKSSANAHFENKKLKFYFNKDGVLIDASTKTIPTEEVKNDNYKIIEDLLKEEEERKAAWIKILEKYEPMLEEEAQTDLYKFLCHTICAGELDDPQKPKVLTIEKLVPGTIFAGKYLRSGKFPKPTFLKYIKNGEKYTKEFYGAGEIIEEININNKTYSADNILEALSEDTPF